MASTTKLAEIPHTALRTYITVARERPPKWYTVRFFLSFLTHAVASDSATSTTTARQPTEDVGFAVLPPNGTGKASRLTGGALSFAPRCNLRPRKQCGPRWRWSRAFSCHSTDAGGISSLIDAKTYLLPSRLEYSIRAVSAKRMYLTPHVFLCLSERLHMKHPTIVCYLSTRTSFPPPGRRCIEYDVTCTLLSVDWLVDSCCGECILWSVKWGKTARARKTAEQNL